MDSKSSFPLLLLVGVIVVVLLLRSRAAAGRAGAGLLGFLATPAPPQASGGWSGQSPPIGTGSNIQQPGPALTGPPAPQYNVPGGSSTGATVDFQQQLIHLAAAAGVDVETTRQAVLMSGSADGAQAQARALAGYGDWSAASTSTGLNAFELKEGRGYGR